MSNDSDQLGAVQGILAEPFAVLSGRGGTGKTKAVTTVLDQIRTNLIDEGILHVGEEQPIGHIDRVYNCPHPNCRGNCLDEAYIEAVVARRRATKVSGQIDLKKFRYFLLHAAY